MFDSCFVTRRLPLATLALLMSGCLGDEPAPAAKDQARPRAEDPPLSHTWNIPAGTSRVTRGDVGSKPPELAEALMKEGTMPSLIHRTTQSCADADTLGSAKEIALRFSVAGGELVTVQGDPKGPATQCFESAFQSERSVFATMPDGFALVRLDLSAPGKG